MDLSAYYYNYYYYNASTSLPTYEFYPFVKNTQSGTYEAQSNIAEDPLNLYEAQSNIVEGPLNLYEEQINSIEGEDEASTDPDSIPLPQELTKLFKPLECELCGVSVICHESAFTHYEGKTHIKNVNAYMKEHYNVYGSLKIKKERFTPVRCDICNIELSSKVVYQQHFSGKQHLKNLKKKQYSVPMTPSYDMAIENDILFKDLPPPPAPPKLSDNVCEVCGITTNTEQQMNFHKNGQKHKRKLAKLNEYKLDNALNSFYNNEWPQGSENGLLSEVSGSVSFIENPEMDYPLQFNDFSEDNDVNVVDEEIESENQNEYLDKNNITHSSQEIIPSSLEAKTYEIPVDLGIENEKLISSTGVFLRQLSFVQQSINSKENGSEANTSSKCNDSECGSSINVEVDQNSAENCTSDTQENCMNRESSAATNLISNSINQSSGNEVSKMISSKQILESNLHKTSSCSLKEQKLALEKLKTMNTTTNDELNKDSQEIGLISEDLKVPQNNNESTSHSTTIEKNKNKIDQVLTKLAIEEIEKESISYGKTRDSKNIISVDISQSCSGGEKIISKYKYDKAGYRINEEIGSKKNDTENDSDRKRYDSNVSNYYYKDRYGSRNYNYNWNTYDNWNYNNYKTYNNNNYCYRNRDERTNGYWRFYDRNYVKSNKRKRDESYCSDEERKRDHKYDKDEKRKRDHRYDEDEEHKRDRHGNDEEGKRYYKNDSGDRQKRDHRYDKDEGRRRNRHGSDEEQRYHKSRRRHKNEKKYSKRKTRRNTSRSRRQRSYNSDSSYSSRSQSKSSPDRDRPKKNRKTEKSSTHKNEKEKDYKSSGRINSDYSDSDSSSSSNSNSSNNHDYRLDKNGICEKQHRCEKAYNNCPYKHKEHFKERAEIQRTESIEKEESWNPEAPDFNKEYPVEIKIKKEENAAEDKIDPALSAYRTSSGTYYCKYCIVSTKSNEMFREHLQTPKHTLLVKFKNKI